MRLRRPVQRIQRFVLARPRTVLAIAAGVSVIALALGFRVEFRTSRAELAPRNDPEQARWTAMTREFAGASALVVAVEASGSAGVRDVPDPQALRRHTDRLAEALRSLPEVDDVFHRVDVRWISKHALFLAPPDALDDALGVLEGLADAERVLRTGAVDELPAVLADRIGRDLAAPGATGGDAQGAASLAGVLANARRFIDDPEAVLAEIPEGDLLASLARSSGRDPGDGYFATGDGETLFAFVTPSTTVDEVATHRRLVDAVRVAAASIPGSDAYRVALTGQPATTVDEMTIVRRDTLFTSTIAVVGVALLTFGVFRYRTHALLVILALGVGVLAAYGAVELEYGYLNLITSAFVSTLVGVGIAYGIHPVSEYEMLGAHTGDPAKNVERAFRHTGPGVATAAVTTSVAFFSVLLMRFRGFAELGLVAGVGVLLCLASALTVLPAALVSYGRARARRARTEEPHERGGVGAAAPEGRRSTAVDRLWVERGATAICRFPWPVTIVAALVTVASGIAATRIGFDTDLLALLPEGSESVRYQRRMIEDSVQSPVFNLVAEETLGDLRATAERAAAEPAIREFQSILDVLPADRDAATAAVSRVRARLEPLVPAATPRPLDARRLAAGFERLEGALADASDAAFGAGLGELAGALEAARADAESLHATAEGATPADVARWDRAVATLWTRVSGFRDRLLEATSGEAPSVATLPPSLARRFVGASGKYLGFLIPAGPPLEPEFRTAYVAACRRVSAESTGFPIVFHHMAGKISRGFYRAVAAGALLVVLTLLIDYRAVRPALLAIVPLGVGIVWTLGAMRVLGIDFNFANLVAIPLVIGVGIDNGVHIVHRLLAEGERGMAVVLRHTGRAILIASATTTLGFGSLALASHRGIASLGAVLAIGVVSCFVTSTVVLPNLLVALGAARR